MLEALRQNSRSAIVYILFGIIIAAFVISFGPGSPSGPIGSTGGEYAAKVAGTTISEADFHFAYLALGFGNAPPEMARQQRIKEFVMDRLIERVLLAGEAEKNGLAASEKEAAEMVADGRLLILGMPRRVEAYAYKDGKFDYDRFRLVAQNHYRVTIKELMEIERREILAEKMRELFRSGTKVSPEEVKADFEIKGLQVNLEYVRFSPRRHEDDVVLTDTDIENWARSHEEPIKKIYEERKAFQYQKVEPSVHLRTILCALDKDAKDAKPEKLKEATDKLAAAQRTLTSGTKFSDVARTTSEDNYSRVRGGDMGWRKKGFTGLGEDADGKVFAAKEGDLVGPIRTDRGLELIKVEGFRKGDISLGSARGEIAEELLRHERQKELAQQAAKVAADKVRAGGKLAELFPKQDSDADEAKPKAGKQAPIQIEETGLFSRHGEVVQGLGPSQALARAAFRTLKPGELYGPVEIGGTFVVLSLKDEKEPDQADWDKRKAEIIEEYGRAKAAEVIQALAKGRCTEVHSKGDIQVNAEILAYESKDPLGLADRKYEPCAGQRPF